MTLSSRDKRALIFLAVAATLCLIVWMIPEQAGAVAVVEGSNTLEATEQRLKYVRRLAGQLPAKQEELERLRKDLEAWQVGLIDADTAQQAQAKLLQILRRLADSQEPPVEFRAVELGQVRPLGQGEDYGEALVSVTFNCAIEQLVNLLADLTAQGEAVVAEELRITTGNPKDKTLAVRLMVAGLLPRSLVPKTNGMGFPGISSRAPTERPRAQPVPLGRAHLRRSAMQSADGKTQ